MSSDFLAKTKDSKNHTFAIQLKTSSALEDARTIEKIEIGRRYWLKKETPWYLVTEKEIPEVVFRNIDWLYRLQAREYCLDQESRFFEFYST